MTRKRKTEQRKARKLRELNAIQNKKRTELKQKSGGASTPIQIGSADNAFYTEKKH